MRKLFFLILTPFLLNSCSTEVDLIGEYTVTPIIYGLLDQSDSLHYIKINKTFLGQGNAFDMAMVPDSSYFENVDATVTEILSDGTESRVWQLRDTIIDTKETNGIFFAPEQRVYYFATPTIENNPALSLQPDATYRLDVNINNGEHIVTGETELIQNVGITSPSSNSSFGFINNQQIYTPVNFVWAKGNAVRFNFKLEFFYEETNTSGVTTEKSVIWNIGEFYSGATSSVSAVAQGETFYQLIRNSIPEDPNIVKREHTYFLITLVSGSEDLNNFITANQPSTSLAQNKPSYTNLTGAQGIFSSRYTIVEKKFFIDPIFQFRRSLNQRSTQELCEGQYTGLLGFCSSHELDNLPGNEETFACD